MSENKFELDDGEKIALIQIALDTYDDYTDDYSRVERIREILKQKLNRSLICCSNVYHLSVQIFYTL